MKSPLSRLLIAVSLCVCTLLQTAGAYDRVRDNLIVFPHVVAGHLGEHYVQSVLVLVNPSSEAIEVEFFDNGAGLFSETLSLAPFEAKELKTAIDDYMAGWVQVSSSDYFAADLTIVMTASEDSAATVSKVGVPGQVPSPKVVTPVRVGSFPGEDTGIALAVRAFPPPEDALRFVLYDSTGGEIAQKIVEPSHYSAMHVTELFPELPETFAFGWLSAELIDDSGNRAQWPMALSMVAIYTGGEKLLTAGSTGLDLPASYSCYLESTDDSDSVITTLAEQYDFDVRSHVSGNPNFTANMTRETARALARDPRVSVVTVDQYIPIP